MVQIVIDSQKDFPGARKMLLPFKEAVEIFVLLKYGNESTKPLKIDTEKPFPGIVAMRLPPKEAVEAFIRWKYGKRIGRDLTENDIHNDDVELHRVCLEYQKYFGQLPFNIPSSPKRRSSQPKPSKAQRRNQDIYRKTFENLFSPRNI